MPHISAAPMVSVALCLLRLRGVPCHAAVQREGGCWCKPVVWVPWHSTAHPVSVGLPSITCWDEPRWGYSWLSGIKVWLRVPGLAARAKALCYFCDTPAWPHSPWAQPDLLRLVSSSTLALQSAPTFCIFL